MYQHHPQFGGDQSPAAVYVDVVTRADVLYVYRDTGVLEKRGEREGDIISGLYSLIPIPDRPYSMFLHKGD